MIDIALRDRTLGYYSAPSAIAAIDAPFRERRETGVDVTIDDEEMRDELTRRHEFAHYRQVMTTPFGFLLWRCYKSLLADVEHIAAEVSLRKPLPAWKVPLHDWARSGGLTAPPGDQRHGYLLHVCDQINVLQDFLAALIGKPHGLTVGAFLRTCELAFAELARRSDLRCDVTFKSRRHADELLYGHDALSGEELMEAAARLEERLVQEDFDRTGTRIARWEAAAIFGVYEPGYRWILAEVGDADVALALLDVAFMTPFDLPFLPGDASEVFIEDLLPAFRLPRLVREAQRHFWPTDDQARDEMLGRTLCEAVGLEAPLSIATRGAKVTYNGPKSWGWDYTERGGPAAFDPGLVFRYFDGEFRRAMQRRIESPSTVHREPYSASLDFRPAVTFYRDFVVFGINDLDQRDDGIELMAALFRHFLHDAELLQALGLPAQHNLEAMQNTLWGRVTKRHERSDWLFDQVDAWRKKGSTDEAIHTFFFGRSFPLFDTHATDGRAHPVSSRGPYPNRLETNNL